MSQLTITLLILLLMIIGYSSGKIALWLVSLCATVLLIITGILDFETAFGNLVDDNLVMMAAVVVLATGLTKANIFSNLGSLAKKFGGSERSLVACFCLIAIVVSQITKAGALLLILTPVIFEVCDECQVSYSRVLLSTSIMIVVAVGWLPVSNGAAAWGRYNALLGKFGYDAMGIWDLAKSRVAGILLVYIWMVTVGYKFAPAVPSLKPQRPEKQENASPALSGSAGQSRSSQVPRNRQILSVVIFALVVAGMITSTWTKFDPAVISVIGAIAMIFTGVLTDKDAIKAIPLNMIIMIGGTLNLAAALKATGAADVVGSWMTALVGGSQNPYIITAIFFILPFICTQFMSNTTVDNIFSTLVLSAATTLPINPVCVLANVRVAGSCGLLSPMATSSVPMVMGFGGYKIREVIKCSLVPVLIVTVCSVFVNAGIFFPYAG